MQQEMHRYLCYINLPLTLLTGVIVAAVVPDEGVIAEVVLVASDTANEDLALVL